VLAELCKRPDEAEAVRRKRKMDLMIGTERVARSSRRKATKKRAGASRPSWIISVGVNGSWSEETEAEQALYSFHYSTEQ
jgi:hypothetical protein